MCAWNSDCNVLDSQGLLERSGPTADLSHRAKDKLRNVRSAPAKRPPNSAKTALYGICRLMQTHADPLYTARLSNSSPFDQHLLGQVGQCRDGFIG